MAAYGSTVRAYAERLGKPQIAEQFKRHWMKRGPQIKNLQASQKNTDSCRQGPLNKGRVQRRQIEELPPSAHRLKRPRSNYSRTDFAKDESLVTMRDDLELDD